MQTEQLSQRYKILHRIGSGGEGEVYAVNDQYLNKMLALKVLSNEDNLRRDENAFFNEFYLSVKFKSRFFAEVFDYGYTSDNHPFYTMELLNESNPEDYLKQSEPESVIEFLYNTGRALVFLHHFNLVHNDLKPENIKISGEIGNYVVKLLDFGLAFDYSPDVPKSRLSGTVEYMAPEHFGESNADLRADLYSLGIMIYKLVSGKFPFSNPDPLKVISDKIEKNPPRIDLNGYSFPENFINIIESLISTDPENRPASSYEMVKTLSKLTNKSDYNPDFKELFASSIRLRLANKIKSGLKLNLIPENIVFSDRIIRQAFCDLLKAELQKDFYEVEIKSSNRQSNHRPVSVNTENTVLINLVELASGQVFNNPDNSEQKSFNLILEPHIGEVAINGEYNELSFDPLTILESWLTDPEPGLDIIEGLEDLSSHDLDSFCEILNDLAQKEIIRYDGRKFTLEEKQFPVYFPSLKILEKIKAEISGIGNIPQQVMESLSILKYGIGKNALLKYLTHYSENTSELLETLVKDRILTVANSRYVFSNQLLRMSIERNLEPDLLKQYHLQISKCIGEHEELSNFHKAQCLAWHYFESDDFENACLWTLKYAKHLVSDTRYNSALRVLSGILKKLEDITLDGKLIKYKASLLDARGDVENKLGKVQESLASFAKIIRLKKDIKDQEIIASAYKQIGDVYKARGKYKRGLKALDKARRIYQELNNQAGLSHTYNNIGNIYYLVANADQALKNYKRALEIQEKLNLQKEIASTLNNIGGCYIIKNQFEKTIEYYKKSIEIKKRINDYPELARTYNNLGAVYHEIDNVTEALKYLQKSLEINRKIDSTREILYNLDNISACEISMGQYLKAEKHAGEGLAIAREINDQPFIATFLMQHGITQFNIGEYGQAERDLLQAEEILKQISFVHVELMVYYGLTKLYKELHDYDKAEKYNDNLQSLAIKTDMDKEIIWTLINKIEILTEQNGNLHKIEKILDEAFVLAEKSGSVKTICHLYLADFELGVRYGDYPADRLEKIEELIEEPINKVEKPRFLYNLARLSVKQKLYNEALDYLSQALGLAEKNRQQSITWKIKQLQGNAQHGLIRYEDAYLSYKSAVNTLKSLTQSLNNKKQINLFLKKPQAQELKEKIVALAKRMGQ